MVSSAFDIVGVSVGVVGSGYSPRVGAVRAPVVAVAFITALKAFISFQVCPTQHGYVLTGLRLVTLSDLELERVHFDSRQRISAIVRWVAVAKKALEIAVPGPSFCARQILQSLSINSPRWFSVSPASTTAQASSEVE